MLRKQGGDSHRAESMESHGSQPIAEQYYSCPLCLCSQSDWLYWNRSCSTHGYCWQQNQNHLTVTPKYIHKKLLASSYSFRLKPDDLLIFVKLRYKKLSFITSSQVFASAGLADSLTDFNSIATKRQANDCGRLRLCDDAQLISRTGTVQDCRCARLAANRGSVFCPLYTNVYAGEYCWGMIMG